MQMFENPQRHSSHGPFRDSGEHRVPQFAEQGAAKSEQAVGDDQYDRYPQQYLAALIFVQIVDDVFQGNRGRNCRQLGDQQESQCQNDTAPEFRQIGPQASDDFPVGFVVGGVLVVSVGAHSGFPSITE